MEDSASTTAPVADDLPDAGPDGPTDVDAALENPDALEGAEAGDISADDAADAAHGEGASGPPGVDEDA
jgi:hypothetical protein